MNKVEIYDPAMCCSSGVCGPGVDPELLRVATIINVLEGEGKKILRHGLSEEPMAFVTSKIVNDLIVNEGVEVLPVTVVDGEVKKKKAYPSNTELAKWSGMTEEEIVKLTVKAQIATVIGKE
ncbi:arsenite efflux transporter metallochaperone ArsD [Acetobacterium tundrae]|uniref:Arsenite efflux transporter metallochaperone ArsD n=1 Tax=Acetobacterium tundrae TaxID=132932 RepID=A0ABR6WN04_9FIRM|nr:arsenite efflux transporter metallochaperone ArsD [Acetobacterium tundrae]MBC3797821.1 arsenite efflux transporter metallochaperone ArsD [Acetobacterium tundrae]